MDTTMHDTLQTGMENKDADKKRRALLYAKIADRAVEEGYSPRNLRLQLLIDIESADLFFDMRLDDWLVADPVSFGHDIAGISMYVDRSKGFPATFGDFVPKFAKKEDEEPMRREELKKSVSEAVGRLFLVYQENSGVASGDISPDDVVRLEQLESDLTDLIISVSESNR